jgi:hypothetical protein
LYKLFITPGKTDPISKKLRCTGLLVEFRGFISRSDWYLPGLQMVCMRSSILDLWSSKLPATPVLKAGRTNENKVARFVEVKKEVFFRVPARRRVNNF